jgi:hypothetical protein
MSDKKYAVVRGGYRVSEIEYTTKDDPFAIAELEHWKKVIAKFPDGTDAKIVEIN